MGILMERKTVKLDKPIIVGCCILDLSKYLMYDFHYNTMIKKYGYEKCKLLMTDTDSLVYQIFTEDFYKDMEDIKDKLDTGNFPESHSLFSKSNNKKVGKFKDENGGKIMKEFVGLKPKMYSYINYNNENSHVKAKGVNTSASKLLRHKDYLDCYEKSVSTKCKMNTLRSYKHQIFAITMNKTGLSPYDDKSYYVDRDTAFRYGHKDIKKIKEKSGVEVSEEEIETV